MAEITATNGVNSEFNQAVVRKAIANSVNHVEAAVELENLISLNNLSPADLSRAGVLLDNLGYGDPELSLADQIAGYMLSPRFAASRSYLEHSGNSGSQYRNVIGAGIFSLVLDESTVDANQLYSIVANPRDPGRLQNSLAHIRSEDPFLAADIDLKIKIQTADTQAFWTVVANIDQQDGALHTHILAHPDFITLFNEHIRKNQLQGPEIERLAAEVSQAHGAAIQTLTDIPHDKVQMELHSFTQDLYSQFFERDYGAIGMELFKPTQTIFDGLPVTQPLGPIQQTEVEVPLELMVREEGERIVHNGNLNAITRASWKKFQYADPNRQTAKFLQAMLEETKVKGFEGQQPFSVGSFGIDGYFTRIDGAASDSVMAIDNLLYVYPMSEGTTITPTSIMAHVETVLTQQKGAEFVNNLRQEYGVGIDSPTISNAAPTLTDTQNAAAATLQPIQSSMRPGHGERSGKHLTRNNQSVRLNTGPALNAIG